MPRTPNSWKSRMPSLTWNGKAFSRAVLVKGCKLNRYNSAAGEYAAACVRVAGSCGVDVLDLWTLMQKDNKDFSVYLSDGLHLSAKGNEFVAAHLWPLLEKKVSLLPTILPLWDEVNYLQPEVSLVETIE